VLLNTAVALAQDPVAMALAFAQAVSAGRLAVDVPDAVMIVRLSPAAAPADGPAPATPQRLAGKSTPNTVDLAWEPPAGAGNLAGYFVLRNSRFLAAVTEPRYHDAGAYLRPGLGYTYEVLAYDAAGRMSAPARTVIVTEAKWPDLVVTDVRTEPTEPKPGEKVTFVSTIKNIGDGPTPHDTVLGATYFVDGQFLAWSDTCRGPLGPGESVVLKANNGPRGTAIWQATAGPHVLRGCIDDINRIPGEKSKYNNTIDRPLMIDVRSQGAILGQTDPSPGSVDLAAEGTEDWGHWGHGGKVAATRKKTGGGRIGDLQEIGKGFTGPQPGFPTSVRWSDGDPTPDAKDSHESVWWNCVGHGHEFAVAADTEWRTLRVYVAGLQAGGKFTARLSDGSAPEYVSTTWARGGCDGNTLYVGPFAAVYTIRYKAGAAGQKLLVNWTLADEQNRFAGQAQLQAATLRRGP